MAEPRISLEQWRALLAVVDAGGYAQAAEALHKSQSSISYAIHKMESLLGLPVFEVVGRKAELTDTGRMLARRARLLLAQARALEEAAQRLAGGWEAEVRLAVDHLFPQGCLFQVLDAFSRQAPLTRIDLLECVLSGGDEALLEGRVDLAILPVVPPGFLGEPLTPVEFVAVSSPDHPLQQIDHPLDLDDLRQHRQLVIRDSGRQRRKDAGWLGAEQRWTVSHMSTSIAAVRRGLGFAWFPAARIAEDLQAGTLRPLNLAAGGRRQEWLHLIFRERDGAGLATQQLAALLRTAVEPADSPASA